MTEQKGFAGLAPASLSRRTAAGVFDAVALGLLAMTFYLAPLWVYGFTLPMWGLLAAVVAYSVIPLAAFRATLGMRLFGVELVLRDGRGANGVDLLFRELVGRALFPCVFLFTVAVGTLASWLGWTRTSMPTGFASLFVLVSLAVAGLAVPGHLLPLLRVDRRSLADLVARTMVIPRREEQAPEDEDERLFWAQQRRQRWVRVVVFELVVLLGGVALPWVLTRPTESTGAYADRLTRAKLEKDFERDVSNELVARQLAQAYQEVGDLEAAEKVKERHLQAVVAKLDCEDARSVLDLGDNLNQESRYEAAISLIQGYSAKCGENLRLEWVSLHAFKQLGEWKAAADIATKLIDDEPEDPDYWWWRGETHEKLKQFEQAAADYHHSMAAEPNGYAAGHYAQWVKKELGRPCEGAFALGLWRSADPEDGGQSWVAQKMSELLLAGDCGKLSGRGKALLRTGSSAALVTESGRIDEVPLRWVVSSAAPYSVIDEATAAKLRLPSHDGKTVRIRVAGETVPARLVTVNKLQVGKASAEQVLTAVVQKLPQGVEGILGVNFLWRFRNAQTGRGLELSPLEENTLTRVERRERQVPVEVIGL